MDGVNGIDWRTEAARRHGLVRTGPVFTGGLTRRQVLTLRRRGELINVHPGVDRVASAPRSFLQRALAATWATDGACSGVTAARLHGLRGFAATDAIHVSISGTARRGLDGVSVHRRTGFGPFDVIERRDGLRLTALGVTLLDLAFDVSPSTLEDVFHQALADNRTTVESVRHVLERLGGEGRTGTCALRALLESYEAPGGTARSRLEVRLLQAIRAAGVARPVLNHRVELPNGATRYIDLAWPGERLAVEVDHPAWHGGPRALRATLDRSLDLGLTGWWVEHLSDEIVEDRPDDAARLIAARLADLRRLAG